MEFDNEEKKSKNKDKVIIFLAVIIVVLSLSVFGILVYKVYFAKDKVEGNNQNASTPISIKYSGGNGGIIVKDVYYAKGTVLTASQVGSSTIITNSNGNTNLNLSISLSSAYFRSISPYYFNIVSYGNNNKKIVQTQCKKITSQKGSATITIKRGTTYVTTSIYKKRNCSGSVVATEKTKVNPAPYITIKPTGTMDSNNVVKVTKSGTYSTNFTINNTTGNTYYYKWFTYKTNSYSSGVSYQGPCKAFNKTVSTGSLGLKVDTSIPNRLGYLRVYTSKSLCEADVNAKYKNTTTNKSKQYYIQSAQIKYEWPNVYQASNGFKMLRYDINDISKKIGSQNSYNCYNYALAYGVYILNGSVSTKHSCDVTKYGASKSGTRAENKTKLFDIIKSKINNGIPVVLHVNNNSGGEHWVLVTGYKIGKSSSNMGISDLYIVDPWMTPLGSKNVTLYSGIMSNDKIAASIRGDYQYRTWSSASSAKACK